MVDGDIWTECRMLMEACRYYDIDAVAEWACAKPISLAAEPKMERSRLKDVLAALPRSDAAAERADAGRAAPLRAGFAKR
ncbi:MAG TPA: hypothetical protein VHG92_04395, partial [Afifellaceae bacterium]|nr:hypothetical protein [Afifellaceae bacterium]